MKVHELFEEEIRTAIYIDSATAAQMVANRASAKLQNCSTGPRDLVSSIVIAESTWDNKENHQKLEELVQSVNAAITSALRKEVAAQIKKQGLNPKEFLMYIKDTKTN